VLSDEGYLGLVKLQDFHLVFIGNLQAGVFSGLLRQSAQDFVVVEVFISFSVEN
jgi:hypothetical protein